jgi:G:T-mismatch repair DNA endonuclease (very short patch repair protein)
MGRIGQIAWNKGLTKETDPRVALNGKHSSETKKKRGVRVWNKGLKGKQKHSIETRIKMSLSAKGHTYRGGSPELGHSVSEDTRKKLSIKSYEQSMRLTKDERIERALNAMKHITRSRTKPELVVENILKSLNILYQSQKKISKICIPDFFIQPNICIFVDGDYWHNIPKIKDRDLAQNQKLKESGYTYIRIWENDTKKHPENIIKILSKYSKK